MLQPFFFICFAVSSFYAEMVEVALKNANNEFVTELVETGAGACNLYIYVQISNFNMKASESYSSL